MKKNMIDIHLTPKNTDPSLNDAINGLFAKPISGQFFKAIPKTCLCLTALTKS
jgi:hypothetical protein